MPVPFTVLDLARALFMLGKQSINKTTPPDSGPVFLGTPPPHLTVDIPKGCQSIRGFNGEALERMGFETGFLYIAPTLLELAMQTKLVSNLPTSAYFCFPSAGIKGKRHPV